MHRSFKPLVAVAALVPVAAGAAGLACARSTDGAAPRFSHPRTIDNPYLPISKTRRCEMRGVESGKQKLTIKVLLDRTRRFEINGQTVQAAIVKDRSWENGRLVERAYDYYAQADDGTVYYLGEDVNYYKSGRMTGHEGSWRYGVQTHTLGVAMPANPTVGDQWALESVGRIASEANALVQKLPSARVRGVVYRDVIRVRAKVEPDHEVENKLYGRGVGVLREAAPDGYVELVRCS
ncbi:MAG TPA: hypothetical protein VGJ70_25135 [Solirubrobacteraceae bacterium]